MIRFSKTYPSFLTVKEGVLLRSSHPSLLIKRAALGNLKASFHCTHWHRFFPIKKAFFYLSVSPARKDFFRKPTRPSLPLRKAPPLTPCPLSSGAREETALQCCICPTCPSPARGSLPYTQALNPYHRD